MLLVLAGAAGCSVNSASGRLVIGRFPPARRGIAMVVRQASQPLGTALAAAVFPPLARLAVLAGAFGFGAALSGAAGVAIALRAVDPPRPAKREGARAPAPYRSGYLWRIHAAAGLLCVPQFVVTGFSLLFLTQARGWSVGAAAGVPSVASLAGAGVRLFAGWWSDRVDSRIAPMRVLAAATVVDLGLLVAGTARDSPAAPVALLLACGLTVSSNGLHNTAVAEYAGPDWAGRALGVHGMAQHAAVVLVPPLAGALIAGHGYVAAFALAAAFPAPAVALLPAADRGARWPGPETVPDPGAGTRAAAGPPIVEV